MAISNYSELKTAIGSWLPRGGSAITGAAGDFITLLESRLNRWQPALRTAEVETTLAGTPGSRSIALPSDFLEPISMFRTTGGEIYESMRPFIPGTVALDVTNGTPQAWGIDGTSIVLSCPEGQADTFAFRYRQKFALSDDTPTNWLLTQHPDAYLFGSLVEACAFMKTAPQAQLWNQRFEVAMDEITTQEARSKSIASLTVDDALKTPRPFNIYQGW